MSTRLIPALPLTKTFFIHLFSICMLTVSAQAQTMHPHYRIYAPAQGKLVTIEEIAAAMDQYDVVFFGEEHNDSIAHQLQTELLKLLHQRFPGRVALSMEMFERDVQMVMDEYLADAIREKNFVKDARVWNNYADYRPMVEFAKASNIPVICANAPARYTNLAGRKGQEALMALSKQAKLHIAPLPYRVAEGAYRQKLEGLMGHGPTGGSDLIVAQSLWDATMAHSIASYWKKNRRTKILHLNGRFHSDEGFAAATQLKHYAPKAKALVISSGSDALFPNIDWEKHKQLGDYVIITDPNIKRSF